MHKNWVIRKYDQSVNLPCTVDEDSSHSKFLIVLLVTLRSIYREQAIITTHKQSLKDPKEHAKEDCENSKRTKSNYFARSDPNFGKKVW
jgi:hypothetical protein